jgi:hypothetical protein
MDGKSRQSSACAELQLTRLLLGDGIICLIGLKYIIISSIYMSLLGGCVGLFAEFPEVASGASHGPLGSREKRPSVSVPKPMNSERVRCLV